MDESRGGVASVGKACKVLRAFSPTIGVLSVRQVSARADIPRSTSHELCRTLLAEGLLEDTGNGYQLGPLPLELAGQIIERTGLVRATAHNRVGQRATAVPLATASPTTVPP